MGMNVGNEVSEFILLAKRRKMSRLRFEGAHKLSSGVDDRSTKIKHPGGSQTTGNSLRVRIQTNAEQRVLIAPGLAQLSRKRRTSSHEVDYRHKC